MLARTPRSLVLAALFALAPPLLHADVVLKPVPTPDLGKLPDATAAQLRDARAQFDKYRQTEVGDALVETYALIASIYARNGFYDSAAVALEDAALLAPKDGRWVYAQGILARAQKRNAVAQNYFDLALGLDREYLPIRIAVARGKLDNGDLEGARKLLAEYVVQHTDQAVPYALLGEIALRQKRYAEAIEQTRRALALEPNATRLYATLADAQAGVGDAKSAAASRAKAGNAEPALADPLGQGLLGQAPTAAAAATDRQPTDADMAALAFAARQYDVARQQLDKALKQDPKNATLLALYARVDAAAGNLGAAKSRAAAAIAADSNNALAHLSQGVALEMASDDGGAQRAYEQAIRVDAKLAEPHLRLGSLLMRTGRASEAVAQFRALVQLDVANQESWMRLVAADVAAGKCAAALRDVSDVLAKDANNAFLLQVFVRVASTCPAASAAQRLGALEYGGKLYKENPTAAVDEAYALALAANGKWDDAVSIQQAAMFILVRNGQKASLPAYREFLKQFQAHQVPGFPWTATAWMFHPARMVPDPKSAPEAATPKK